MGLRSRLKQRVKQVLGRDDGGADRVAPPVPSAAPSSSPAPSSKPAPAPPRSKEGAASTAAAGAAPKKIDPDKKRMARLKAKKAVLQFLIKEGGEANMAAMHDFSERRYFVAHKAFSDLMEEFLAEELIDFDDDSYQATITAEGRRWVDAATHIKTREKM